jgi:Zn-dependent protease
LHGIGGLASCNDCDPRPSSRILIALAGPAAGFVFAALVVGIMRLLGQAIGWTPGSRIPWNEAGITEARGLSLLGGTLYWEPFASPHINTLLSYVLQVNILWGLINLLPVYPLDGGQVMRELCTLRSVRGGVVLSLRISMLTGFAMALAALLMMDSIYVALLFGYLGFTSYRALQSYQSSPW